MGRFALQWGWWCQDRARRTSRSRQLVGPLVPLSSHQSPDVRLMSKTAEPCGSQAGLGLRPVLAMSGQHEA